MTSRARIPNSMHTSTLIFGPGRPYSDLPRSNHSTLTDSVDASRTPPEASSDFPHNSLDSPLPLPPP